jgi:hypothetical protein
MFSAKRKLIPADTTSSAVSVRVGAGTLRRILWVSVAAHEPTSTSTYSVDDPTGKKDPFGLYEVKHFDDPDAEAINRALQKLWNFLNSQHAV